MGNHGRVLIGGAILLALLPGCGPDERGNAQGAERTLVLKPRRFEVTLGFTGRITPGERVEVLAPFDGVVTTLHVTFGDRVAKGDRLLSLNPTELERECREAEAAFLRAEAEAERLLNWTDGPEMSRARRDVASTHADLSDLERRLEETKVLLERGLVPRSEYDGLIRQRRSLRTKLVQAREQLEATRKRGEGANRRIALLERDLARERLDRVQEALSRSTLLAPVSGVVVRPPEDETEAAGVLRSGIRVTRGRPLLVIARPDGLDVAFLLDEADVNALEPGVPVRVTGPGFPGMVLKGTLTGVAGQAESGAGGKKAAFTASARLDPLSEAAARSVRIGMTADIDVILFQSDNALVVPSEAVEGTPADAWVNVRNAPGAPVRRVRVEIEIVGPNGAVIRSGVSPGDIVVWTVSGR